MTQSQRQLGAAHTRQQYPVLTKLKRVKPVNLKKTKRHWQSGLINVTADDHASIQHYVLTFTCRELAIINFNP